MTAHRGASSTIKINDGSESSWKLPSWSKKKGAPKPEDEEKEEEEEEKEIKAKRSSTSGMLKYVIGALILGVILYMATRSS